MFWWNEAVEAVEATEVIEAVEVIEAAEVPDAREITQYAKCKLSFSVKRHKRANNVRKIIENVFTLGTFKLFFAFFISALFLLEAVENRDVTFNKIEGS